MIEQPHQPGYSTGTLYRCGREACSGYWDATGRPAPEGTLICRAPLCGDACERVPASTDEIVEGDCMGMNAQLIRGGV